MATLKQCRAIVDEMAAKYNATDAAARKKHIPNRTVELTILDLDTSFRGRLVDGELVDVIETHAGPKPNVRLVMSSDDLVDLTNGTLKFAAAWASGRVRLDASLRDLLRLRGLL